MNREIKYRPEIDGLRTVAVLGVIFFHLNPERLKGGFLGVDVFFVISGYLITSIIYRQILERRFSFWSFLKRRFKRLYPALAVVVIMTLAIGLLILPNPEREALPKQALGALFSFSNILLWRTTGGYWSSASENISLLHTWSLSLEEQFYICFPIFLFLGSILLKKRLGFLTFLLFILSLSLCVVFSNSKPSPTFYLLPTRMWELLIGSLLAIYSPFLLRTTRSVKVGSMLHLLGLALIIISYFTIENKDGFPGLYPLVPCLGTFLLLAIKCKESLVVRVLSTGVFVYVGKISYSLYLWHWPIIVYAYYLTPQPSVIALITITFIVAIGSYHMIEQPLRQASQLPRFPVFAAASALIVCFLGFIILPKSPLLKELGNFDEADAFTRGWEFEATQSLLNQKTDFRVSPDRDTIAVTGSSHARVICKPIQEYANDNDYEFLSLTTSGVGITSSDSKATPFAEEINAARFDLLEKVQPNILIIAGMWSSELNVDDRREVLKERLEEALSVANKVIVFGQVPLIELPHRYENALRKYIVARHIQNQSKGIKPSLVFPQSQAVSESNGIVERVVSEIASERLFYVNPTDFFTNTEGNVSLMDERGMFLYSDYHHINDYGAHLLFTESILPLFSQPD